MTRPLCIGMSLAPTWLSGAGWRSPDSGIEGLYTGELALQTAQAAEAAHLDFVFLPDTLSLTVEPMAQSFGFASLDPTLLMASLAHRTRQIGLVTTIATTFGRPYHVARQLMSLHWLSGGRAGWNIVTALQGHENFGLDQMPDSAARYARAAEFTAAVRALWASFPAEALILDREAGQFADTSRLAAAGLEGAGFRIAGPLNLPALPGPRLPLVQAGASGPGRDFAASVADLVFAPTPDMEAALDLRADLPGLSLHLAPTRREAQELFRHTHSRMDTARRIARFHAATGLDLTGWPKDRPVTLADLPEPAFPPETRTHADLMRRPDAPDDRARCAAARGSSVAPGTAVGLALADRRNGAGCLCRDPPLARGRGHRRVHLHPRRRTPLARSRPGRAGAAAGRGRAVPQGLGRGQLPRPSRRRLRAVTQPPRRRVDPAAVSASTPRCSLAPTGICA